MKYVITGGAGHISKPLAEKLLKAGHDVTVVGRSAENLKPITYNRKGNYLSYGVKLVPNYDLCPLNAEQLRSVDFWK